MKKVNWKVYGEALDALQAQFSAEDGIQIHNCNFARQGTPVKMGVQWASLGTKSPEEAAEYADRILDAAMAAEHFVYNGYVVDYKGGDQFWHEGQAERRGHWFAYHSIGRDV